MSLSALESEFSKSGSDRYRSQVRKIIRLQCWLFPLKSQRPGLCFLPCLLEARGPTAFVMNGMTRKETEAAQKGNTCFPTSQRLYKPGLEPESSETLV